VELRSTDFALSLQTYVAAAPISSFWPFRPDPSRLRVDSRQHRRRICDGYHASIHQIPSDRTRLGDRTCYSPWACEGSWTGSAWAAGRGPSIV